MRLALSVLAIAACAACYRGPEDIPSEKVAPVVTRQGAATEACADTLYQRLLARPGGQPVGAAIRAVPHPRRGLRGLARTHPAGAVA